MNLTERIKKLEARVESCICGIDTMVKMLDSFNQNLISKLDQTLQDSSSILSKQLEEYNLDSVKRIELFKNNLNDIFLLLNEMQSMNKSYFLNVNDNINKLDQTLQDSSSILSKQLEEYNVKNISYRTEEINKIKYLQNYMNEMYFARLLADSIRNSLWLKDKNISLYEWAANYSFIYILFRILDKVSLNNILEFGLGQTSKLTTQYAKFKNQQSKLFICEHNGDWIEIYKKELELSENSNINLLGLEEFEEEFEYDGGINDKYSNLSSLICDVKFNLIIVDGPVGGGKNLPRTNILDVIENGNLDDEFIIIIDDSSRQGEKNTILKVENLLSNKDIKYTKFTRSGIKEQTIIVYEGYSLLDIYKTLKRLIKKYIKILYIFYIFIILRKKEFL